MNSILIIDDELSIRETLEQILSYEGYTAFKAGSGPEALSLLEKEEPDAILLDVKMPGMDGFEVLARLKEMGRKIPVIQPSTPRRSISMTILSSMRAHTQMSRLFATKATKQRPSIFPPTTGEHLRRTPPPS